MFSRPNVADEGRLRSAGAHRRHDEVRSDDERRRGAKAARRDTTASEGARLRAAENDERAKDESSAGGGRVLVLEAAPTMARPFDPVIAPPLAEQEGRTFPRLVELMQRLLAPDGCPWDREQSMSTIRRYVLEEACEVVDAIDDGDREELRTELGDLLLQVVFLGELGRKEGSFGPDDVIAAICDKLVRRHPHVFADEKLEGSSEVLRNWERIKAAEKKGKRNESKGGVLGGVPRSLPALTRAQRVGEKVARVGFDWPDARGSRSKVAEEVSELDQAIASGDKDKIEAELGDVLFALVNLARHVDVDAEGALRRTIDKFSRRFSHVEARVHETHGGWPTTANDDRLTLEELDGYWDEAKRAENAASAEAPTKAAAAASPGDAPTGDASEKV
ncbi:Nucleoside triphosphate pyrophosphohydrolase MazG [Minicystis rosea]|nr:Nucleoside triphosphate pyrophosphohydrolase MazG [Minicystis rosea]